MGKCNVNSSLLKSLKKLQTYFVQAYHIVEVDKGITQSVMPFHTPVCIRKGEFRIET